MCKILLTTIRELAQAWYNNIELGFILGFNNLSAKLLSWFSTNIPAKRSSAEHFGVTQSKEESTRTYLKRFNGQMLKIEELIKAIASNALISGVRKYFI